MNKNNTLVKYGCYTTSISQAIVTNITPLFFLTFKEMYGISYSLLGSLVLINFFTQLIIDLIFSFFSHKFNVSLAVKLTPVISAAGLITYATLPFILPKNLTYLGLAIGTIIFSAAAGLAEVLVSPVIAELPSDNPDRDMSRLHSMYAWGCVGVIIFATIFLLLIGPAYWQVLTYILTLVPLGASFLLAGTKIPKMETPEKVSGVLEILKNKGVWLCFIAIFLGGATELVMAQWSSSFLEQALGIPKVWGDIFGVALFGLALGMGRTLYAKTGKNISRVLLLGAIGATLCYFTAAIINIPVIGLLACAFTGFCASMMWPGSLIVASDRFPAGGVFIYAMMAAGGDLGASLGPQLIGIITDAVSLSPTAISLANQLSLSPESLGMKAGMLVAMLFPLAGIFVYNHIRKTGKKNK
ncbi:MAG: MFS transporter [Ruminococcaceae bacterium]|nr:MFS transporter [Oscillospiraceae bacterium]